MKLLILLTILMTSTVWAQKDCSTPISRDELTATISQIKDQYFPDLKDVDLKIKVLRSNAYFLQTFVKITTAFKAPFKRTYGIQINEKLFECSPTMAAVKAILIHEIKHIQDYTTMRSVSLESFALKYLLSKKFRTFYERQTDEATLELGHAEGLKEYREWVYQWLNERQLATKKRFYFTPEEIDLWVQNHP